MDEYLIIFRSLVWLKFIIVLIINEKIMIIIKNLKVKLFIIKIIGAIFCHVVKIKQFAHERPSITSGNQKWKGAAPSLVRRAEFNIIRNVEFISGAINSFVNNIKIIENRRIIDAKAWVIKYFIADSDENIFFVDVIKGIIERRLISRPIHILNHEYEQIEIRVPIINVLKKMILYSLIKKRRV